MENGALVISLDFELLWGVFDKVDWRDKKHYFQNTRNLIPEMLSLFKEYEISCTWATVGMLFNKDWEEWKKNIPSDLPEYENRRLSAYQYGKSIICKETENLCFAPEIIQQIAETPFQEIGTHTYSHYYCLEPGQNVSSFKEDLQKCKELAGNAGIQLKSLVFPRNQFNSEYLKTCKEFGVTSVRSNPDVWYWQNTQKDSLQQKVFRTGDAYIGFKDKSYKNISEINSGIFGQKASRLLRPYSTNNFLNKLKLNRIKSEMTAAARIKEIYHLWWHPHNFGDHPEENLKDLKHLLDHFKTCQREHDFQSANMKDLI